MNILESTRENTAEISVANLRATKYAQESHRHLGAPKKQRSKAMLLLAFMKRLIPDDFVLDVSAADSHA